MSDGTRDDGGNNHATPINRRAAARLRPVSYKVPRTGCNIDLLYTHSQRLAKCQNRVEPQVCVSNSETPFTRYNRLSNRLNNRFVSSLKPTTFCISRSRVIQRRLFKMKMNIDDTAYTLYIQCLCRHTSPDSLRRAQCCCSCGRSPSSPFREHRVAIVVPLTRRPTLGDRPFPVAAARAWNDLPPTIADFT